MSFDFNSRIEIVKASGILRQCFVINEEGERIVELPLRAVREQGNAGEQGIVTLELHSLRVIHTDAD